MLSKGNWQDGDNGHQNCFQFLQITPKSGNQQCKPFPSHGVKFRPLITVPSTGGSFGLMALLPEPVFSLSIGRIYASLLSWLKSSSNFLRLLSPQDEEEEDNSHFGLCFVFSFELWVIYALLPRSHHCNWWASRFICSLRALSTWHSLVGLL